MSIIHEALKKVQSNRSQNNKEEILLPKPPLQPAESASVQKIETPAVGPSAKIPAKKFPFDLIVWGVVLTTLIGFLFFNLQEFMNRLTEIAAFNAAPKPAATVIVVPPVTPSVAISPPVATVEAPPPAPPTPPAPPKRQKGELVLYGITFMDGKEFALINDGIYQVGDDVEGAKIDRITNQSVIVTQKGKTKILKVLNKSVTNQ